MRRAIAVLFFGLAAAFPEAARAAVVPAATCSAPDVMTAVRAASDGDTVAVPSGECLWSAEGAVALENKNVVLQGAGLGSTVISISAPGAIEAPATNAKPFRITGFTFRSTVNIGTDNGYAMMRIWGGKGWRVDHNEFQIFSDVVSCAGGNGIHLRRDIAGVVDHNRFVNHPDQLVSGGCMHASVYPEGDGGNAWSLPDGQIYSPDHAVFIEDNYFREAKYCPTHNAHAGYGQMGGIYVFRHNEVRNMNVDSHGFEVTFSTREYEVSDNDFVAEPLTASANVYEAILMRGGSGVITGNVFRGEGTGSFTYGVGLTEYRVSTDSRGNPARPELYGGVPASSCCPGNEGWPCVDQIGRGQSVGASPNKTQSSNPLYIWDNDFSGVRSSVVYVQEATSGTCGGAIGDFIQDGRDYFFDRGAKPGYAPYAYPHPLAAAPGTPSAPSGLAVQ